MLDYICMNPKCKGCKKYDVIALEYAKAGKCRFCHRALKETKEYQRRINYFVDADISFRRVATTWYVALLSLMAFPWDARQCMKLNKNRICTLQYQIGDVMEKIQKELKEIYGNE